jgi:AcrR family transcriptional regulator
MVATARRTPQQQRSRAKVDAILDAADRIVARRGVEGLSTTLLASRAGIAVGTLYQYFHSVDDVVAALVSRHAERFADELRAALAGRRFRRKREAANAALDALIEYYRTHPSFRALWRGAPGPTGRGFGDASELLVGIVLDELEAQGLASRADDAFVLEAEVQWSVAEGLIRLAFRRDPDGDAAVLAHLRRLFALDVKPVAG